MKVKFKIILILMLLFLSCTTVKDSYSYIEEEKIHYYTYNGVDIKYSDQGEGTPLLFIHGLASSSYSWRHLSQYYKDNYRVICLDLKGFGESNKPENGNYELKEQSQLILNFIKELNLKNMTVVGHSMGGAVSMCSYINGCSDIKERINRLILIDTAAYIQKIPTYIEILRTPLLNKMVLNTIPHELTVSIVLNELFYDDLLITNDMIEVYSNYLWGPGAQEALIESSMDLTSDYMLSISERYKEIDVPTLIIWGNNDSVVKPAIGEKLVKVLPNADLKIIENCGHNPMEEDPEDTIKIIDNFLNS